MGEPPAILVLETPSSIKVCSSISYQKTLISYRSNTFFFFYFFFLFFFLIFRFEEVAELRTISWLEIQGMLNTRLLSPGTIYGAYLIVNFAGRAYGLDFLPSEVSLEVGNFRSRGNVYLTRPETKKQDPLGLGYLSSASRRRSKVSEERELVPVERKDGWIEIEFGHFYNNHQGDGEVKMCLKEVKGEHLKGGLLVEGIELRPKE